MKKIFTILIICAFALLLKTEANAQIVKGEGFIGFNLSQVDGDQVYGYKNLGLHGGIGALVPVYQKNNFSIDTSKSHIQRHHQ